MLIDGRKIARELYEGLGRRPTPQARMVAVLIGQNAASASFVARKAEAAKKLGVGFEVVVFSGIESQGDIEKALMSLSCDASVGGIILQLPVAREYDKGALIRAIGVQKDVDNLSGLSSVIPPAVLAVQAVLLSCGKELRDYAAVRIVGNGFLVGAPIARFCVEQNIPYKVANSKTENLFDFVRDADLVITGVGKAGIVNPDWLKDGAGAIDFGFPSDFNQDALCVNESRLAFYTPTPFGTGPILIAKLFENFYALNGGPQSPWG